MKNMLPFIIDNISEKQILRDIVKDLFADADSADIETGYFYISGFRLVRKDLAGVSKIRMIIGDETNRATKDELVRGFERRYLVDLKSDMGSIGDTEENRGRIKTLQDLIADGVLEVRIYNDAKLHGKVYIFNGLSGIQDRLAIGGSSNFSRGGLEGNEEMNFSFTSKNDVDKLSKWFEERWSKSKDFKDELLNVVNESTMGVRILEKDDEYLSPEDLWKKIIFEYLNGMVTVGKDFLADFQKIGVENALDKIYDYNGVIISDSVGLGKTYIAGDVIRHYMELGGNILCMVPSGIKSQWRDVLGGEFGLNLDKIKVISHAKFSLCKDAVAEYGSYDFVVIDEAHRFRNKDIRKNDNIKLLKGHKFLLLTATPLNNSVLDLRNLIDIFVSKNRLFSLKQLNVDCFNGYLKLAKKERSGKSLSGEEDREKLRCFGEIGKILEEVMILRTRSIIKKKYPNIEIGGKRVEFLSPKIEMIDYDMSEQLKKLEEVLPELSPVDEDDKMVSVVGDTDDSDFITDFIVGLHLPHMNLGGDDKTVAGLYKITLLKRLESSIYTFRSSLGKLRQREIGLKNDLDNMDWNDVVEKYMKKKINVSYLEGDIDLQSCIEDFVSQGKEIVGEDKTTNFMKLQENIKKHIVEDLASIDEFIGRINTLKGAGEYDYDDTKLNKVLEKLLGNCDKKMLIFTQFRDTVDYLGHHVNQYFDGLDRKIVLAKGGIKDKVKIAKRFSPLSHGCRVVNGIVFEGEEKEIELGSEIDILISTDTYSEGVNFQDCNIVFNYDLPWNPTRLIQRVGRIDRIGSNDRKFVFNVKTDDEIDAMLNLMSKLQNKIRDISSILGREYGILSEDEVVNPKTIGERITEIRESEDMEDLEDATTGGILEGVKIGADDVSRIRLGLKDEIKRSALDNFDVFDNLGYCIMKGNKKFVFAYFKIYNKKTRRTYRDVILRMVDGKIEEIEPMDCIGGYGGTINGKKKYEKDVRVIRKHFESEILGPMRKEMGFAPDERFPKIQWSVVNRLDRMMGYKRLGGVSNETCRKWRRIYSVAGFSMIDGMMLKTEFGGKLSGGTDEKEFFRILRKFKREVIDNNFNYQERTALRKEIGAKQICWGAFI